LVIGEVPAVVTETEVEPAADTDDETVATVVTATLPVLPPHPATINTTALASTRFVAASPI
jgi:hypothetical protein